MKQLITLTVIFATLTANTQTIDTLPKPHAKDTIIVMVQQQQPTAKDVTKTFTTVLITTVLISTVAYMIPFMLAR